MTFRDPGRDVGEVLAELGMDRRATQDEIDTAWDSVAAAVTRSTDDQLRATHPGMDDEAIARWRRLAANPILPKQVTDFWYRPVKAAAS